MDWRKCLLGINVLVLCSIIPVRSYFADPDDVMLEVLAFDKNGQVKPDMFGELPIWEGQSLEDAISRLNLTAHGSMPPQSKENPDACYMVVGILSPLDSTTEYRPFPNKTQCMYSQMMGAEMEQRIMPTIGDRDDVLQYPKCIKPTENLGDVDLLEVIRVNNRSYCGMYRLALILDAARLAEKDDNFCNNYVTIDVDFKCSDRSSTESRCELESPDSDDEEEAVLFFKDQMEEGQMHNNYRRQFKQTVKKYMKYQDTDTKWHEDKPDSQRMGEEKQKFRAIKKVLNKYVEGKIKQHGVAYMCPGDVKDQLDQLQGLHKEHQSEEGMFEPEQEENRRFLQTLLESVDALHGLEYSPDETIVTDAIKRLRSEYTQHHGIISEGLAERVLVELATLLRANKKEHAKKHLAMSACKVSNVLESLAQGYSMDNGNYHYADERRHMLGETTNTTAMLAVGLMYFYPNFYGKCYENILMRLNNMTKDFYQGGRPDMKWILDQDFLKALNNKSNNLDEYQYYELMRHCSKPNPCIMKLRSMCNQADSPMAYEKSVETIREDVCKKKMMKTILSRHKQSLSKNSMMRNNTFDAVCQSEDKMSLGRSSMLKIEKGVINKVLLNLDNTMVIVKPVARCRCQKCDSHTSYKGDRNDGSDWETNSEGENGWSENSGDRNDHYVRGDKNENGPWDSSGDAGSSNAEGEELFEGSGGRRDHYGNGDSDGNNNGGYDGYGEKWEH